MKRTYILFLQLVVVLIGLGVLALLLWEPHLEGRNAHATVFQIYFNDPFLAYAYAAALAFFVAPYQAFKLLRYVGRNEVFSKHSVKALQTIKYCAITIVAFIMGAEAYIIIALGGKDDVAGGVMMGLVLMLISIVVATVAAVFEKTLESAVEMKSENELTV